MPYQLGDYIHEVLEFDLHTFIESSVGEWGISRTLFLSLVYVALLALLAQEVPNLPLFAFNWLVGTAPLWAPVALGISIWKMWIWYVRVAFISGRNPILLEVKMPREITKSPRAMESALTNLWMTSGEVTFINRWWKGQVRPWYSLELASFGGEVHFYIWTWKAYKNTIEASLYSHYPELEIYEVEDYASKFKYDPKQHLCYGIGWRFEPRSDAYPIRTYVEFELDKDPKEEYKMDPFAQVVELLSSVKKTEQIWVQILFRANDKDKVRIPGTLFQFKARRDYIIEKEIKKIREESFLRPPADIAGAARPMPSWKQTEQVRAIERNQGKLGFDIIGRGIYISTPKDFSGPGYNMVRWLWRPFGNPQYLNQYRPRFWHAPFDYPWQDYKDFRWTLTTRRFFDAFRRRSGFHSPWISPFNITSPEVIATIWHPPSSSVKAPGLERIPATKAEAPPNLPK